MVSDTAFLFAGQGAQKIGMADALLSNSAAAKIFERGEELLPGITRIIAEDAEKLNRTQYTQPAVFLTDLADAAVKAETISPAAVCGFSVGEIPALVFAGALSFEDGFELIKLRAALMQKACEKRPGVMIAAVGIAPEDAEKAAADAGGWAVNYNAPLQTVIAAPAEKEQTLLDVLASKKARGIKLKVSGAFHCPLMREAAEGLREFLHNVEFKTPVIPVYANVSALPYSGDMKELLARQTESPVIFTQTITNMESAGINNFVECGPGNVLTGLVKKIKGN